MDQLGIVFYIVITLIMWIASSLIVNLLFKKSRFNPGFAKLLSFYGIFFVAFAVLQIFIIRNSVAAYLSSPILYLVLFRVFFSEQKTGFYKYSILSFVVTAILYMLMILIF